MFLKNQNALYVSFQNMWKEVLKIPNKSSKWWCFFCSKVASSSEFLLSISDLAHDNLDYQSLQPDVNCIWWNKELIYEYKNVKIKH